MNVDSDKLFRDIESFLERHPQATSRIIAETLGRTRQEIDQTILDHEGLSLQEYRERRRLAKAFQQLVVNRAINSGPWEKERKSPRIIIPRTTVRYHIRQFWMSRKNYSRQCPLIDLSTGGLAFLNDFAPRSGKRVSLLLSFPEKGPELQVEGRIVYAVATGIAGYRYRVGVEFLPFSGRKGGNDPEVMEVLAKFEDRLKNSPPAE